MKLFKSTESRVKIIDKAETYIFLALMLGLFLGLVVGLFLPVQGRF